MFLVLSKGNFVLVVKSEKFLFLLFCIKKKTSDDLQQY